MMGLPQTLDQLVAWFLLVVLGLVLCAIWLAYAVRGRRAINIEVAAGPLTLRIGSREEADPVERSGTPKRSPLE